MPDARSNASSPSPVSSQGKVGILLANLGTPDGYDYWSMRRYLSEFLSDKRVIDYPSWKWQPLLQLIILSKRPFSSGAAYRSIWNHDRDASPLLVITQDQTAAISEAMQDQFGEQVMVDFAMRYGKPSTKSKVQKMVAAGCDRILYFPLYPQYAGATTATANDAFFQALMQEKAQPASRTVPAYFDQPDYIESLAQSIERAYGNLATRPDVLVVSYHGMPIRYCAEGDPYHDHCQETSRLLRARLGWNEGEIVTTFQSQFGPEEWLQPYTVEEVARLARSGNKKIAVVAPAFSADCIETLEEINEEIKDSFAAAGGEEFSYIPCLNDDPAHIRALTAIIKQNLRGWLG